MVASDARVDRPGSERRRGEDDPARFACTFGRSYSSSPNVKVLTLSIGCVLSFCLAAEGRELGEVLKGVEARYNRAGTLAVHFEQRYLQGGRAQRAESGELSLRKPGRMRWPMARTCSTASSGSSVTLIRSRSLALIVRSRTMRSRRNSSIGCQ